MANPANNTQQIGQLIMYRVSSRKSSVNFSKTRICNLKGYNTSENNRTVREAAARVRFNTLIELCK